MTLLSARQFKSSLTKGSELDGYCLPISIDAALPVSSLSRDFYEYAKAGFQSPTSSHNDVISVILREFFNVEPRNDAKDAPIAKFDAFDGSAQSYFNDVAYEMDPEEYPVLIEEGVTNAQFRMKELLVQATKSSCITLFTEENSRGEHSKLLHVTDTGRSSLRALFVVIDNTEVNEMCLYDPNTLSGINKHPFAGKYSPLPEIRRDRFPDGQRSWELIILPPDPAI